MGKKIKCKKLSKEQEIDLVLKKTEELLTSAEALLDEIKKRKV
jgi:hypothetical protein